MKYILIVNGFSRSGKDTFMDYLSNISSIPVYKVSWVDWVKGFIREKYNWDGTKDLYWRKIMADYADMYTDLCLHYITERIPTEDEYIYCIAARRSCDIDTLTEYFSADRGFITNSICIRRSSVENVEQSNSADENILDHQYDYFIDNNTEMHNDPELDEFKANIKIFYDGLRGSIPF